MAPLEQRRCRCTTRSALQFFLNRGRRLRYYQGDESDGAGVIRLIVGFQPLMVISPTTSCIRWCMQVYAW